MGRNSIRVEPPEDEDDFERRPGDTVLLHLGFAQGVLVSAAWAQRARKLRQALMLYRDENVPLLAR